MTHIISNLAQKMKFIFITHYLKLAQQVTALYTYIRLLYAHMKLDPSIRRKSITWGTENILTFDTGVKSMMEKTASKLLIYLLNAIGLTTGGSCIVHTYTKQH